MSVYRKMIIWVSAFLLVIGSSLPIQSSAQRRQATKSVDIKTVVSDFNSYLETVPFYASASLEDERTVVEEHINNLNNWKDRAAYIAEHRLNTFISTSRDSLKRQTEDVGKLVSDFLTAKYINKTLENREACVDSLKSIVRERIQQREELLNRLEKEINSNMATENGLGSLNWQAIAIGLAVFILLSALAWMMSRSKGKNKSKSMPQYASQSHSSGPNASQDIVVRRKTATILRKQSLEDVIDNGAYLKVDCNDFCHDSAVRRMYIKNTCIKDIYAMYAEDLRKSKNPNENGCMVLGRWVHDAESNEYYVSLEHIVLPGDDAVFSEYELNFGGKIKLKVTEKLRKLRKETNLQYDLTCWVHSHPGLGVFFSNSDSSVQMQLKSPSHPNFLTAIVIDILTPKQDIGIFTFRQDGELNSKADLKKMYSLEEWNQWALESERNTFNADEHLDALANAKAHLDDCHAIQLSNNAVIDIDMLISEQTDGLVGLVHGYDNKQGEKTDVVVVQVTKDGSGADKGLIGCLVSAAHCSIPSVRKMVADVQDKIKFVMVYTPSDGMLTSIPMVNQELCTEQDYYGEYQLEELKIWTRRKR